MLQRGPAGVGGGGNWGTLKQAQSELFAGEWSVRRAAVSGVKANAITGITA